MSRREALRRAGWVVPAIVALPLVASPAHATWRTKYASPGNTYSSGSGSGSGSGSYSGSSDQTWTVGGFLNFLNWFRF